jgi:hypothetical protein
VFARPQSVLSFDDGLQFPGVDAHEDRFIRLRWQGHIPAEGVAPLLWKKQRQQQLRLRTTPSRAEERQIKEASPEAIWQQIEALTLL